MLYFIITFLINAVSLYLVVHIVNGAQINGMWALALSTIVIALLNTFVRPLLIFFTLPLNILTLGIFILFINALLILLASKIVTGFYIDSYWTAFVVALLFSIISTLASYLIK
jgi:putative membrane protein